ncbi:MAG: purine-nucleoside phosphorylase [Synergistaceae bacterium]|nr:purine-nucleoside phosphorylase [Synergistaceae bacterium]
MSTPHNSASPGDFAKTVLMPGDPMRSKFIAETYLENPVLVNNVRGVHGYTGTYNGKRVSVMASGMGIPSISIYSYELYHFYGVENIIRVGTIGSLSAEVNPRDIIIAESALCEVDFSAYYPQITDDAYKCSPALLEKAISSATEKGLRFFVGPVYSSEMFYSETDIVMRYADKGAIGTEMEAAALYCNAYIAGKNALAVCTVSDSMVTGESLPSADRESGFRAMMELALDIA